MVVLTNGFEEVQHIKVSQSNLGQYFEEIITSDSLGFKKPHPQAYALALERVGAKPQDVIMIGDNFEADVLGAKEAGLGQIYFNPEGTKYEEEIDHEVKLYGNIRHSITLAIWQTIKNLSSILSYQKKYQVEHILTLQ